MPLGTPALAQSRIQSSRSTSSDRFILLVMVEKISLFWRRSGSGNSILRSRRPGRSRAGSRVSALLVAMITWHGGRGKASSDGCHPHSPSGHETCPFYVPGPACPTWPTPYLPLRTPTPNLDVDVLVESIHLIEQLQQDSLHLSVSWTRDPQSVLGIPGLPHRAT